jgi:UDP-glucose 4-epimerase
MKILVTGGAGFIGSWVVDLLVDEGHSVVVVDDLSTGSKSNLNRKAKFYKLDIRTPGLEKVFSREQPEVVCHLAAQTSIATSIETPRFDADVNIIGSVNLMEASRHYGVKRFVFASSVAVYGEPEYLPCDEVHPTNPLSPYGVTKNTVEHYLYVYWINFKLNYVVLRFTNIYGPRQDPLGEAGVVAIFSYQMLNGKQVVINGDGNQERDFMFAADAAAGVVAAIKSPTGAEPHRHPLSSTYNLGTGEATSITTLFDHFSTLASYNRHPLHGPARPGEIYGMTVDNSKAKKDFAWEPKTPLLEGLQQTVEWFKKKK